MCMQTSRSAPNALIGTPRLKLSLCVTQLCDTQFLPCLTPGSVCWVYAAPFETSECNDPQCETICTQLVLYRGDSWGEGSKSVIRWPWLNVLTGGGQSHIFIHLDPEGTPLHAQALEAQHCQYC
jgi:hypothetical protein